jgi:hypothetical protein
MVVAGSEEFAPSRAGASYTPAFLSAEIQAAPKMVTLDDF